MSFNVLTDPWIPLADDGGLASYVEVMTGARDAADLDHPRDDCRFFTRMLLSALTQALFPATNVSELRQLIAAPLAAPSVNARIGEVQSDFDLLSTSAPWMQAAAATGTENETSKILLEVAKHRLFRPAIASDALCAPCAVPMLYGLQAFVPKGGQGYSPNVRGAPPTTTLVLLPESVRQTAWANTLHPERAQSIVYGPEPERPWLFHSQARDGTAIGLVEGLFWKPRSLRLIEAASDRCVACGQTGRPVYSAVGYAKRQQRTGDLYRHPMTPCRIRRTKTTSALRFTKLSGDRPTWTNLADLVSPIQGDTEGSLPAPVVAQWTEELAEPGDRTSLLVLDFGTQDASITHRFVENFPLSLRLTDRDVIEGVRARIAEAEEALGELQTACVRLHMKSRPSKRLGKAQSTRARKEKELVHDVTAAFWQRTEAPFWRSYEATLGPEEQKMIDAEDDFRSALRKTALHLFDEHASASISDPSRVAVLAEVRAKLASNLPFPAGPSQARAAPVADARPEGL